MKTKRLTRKTVTRAGLVAGLGLSAVFVAGIAQFSQLVVTTNDVRQTALADWAGSDEQRQHLATEFTTTCLVGGPKQPPVGDAQKPSHIVSVSSCASAHGYDDLAALVREADEPLKTLAWPLSMLAS